MTSHELARKLLEIPDGQVGVEVVHEEGPAWDRFSSVQFEEITEIHLDCTSGKKKITLA